MSINNKILEFIKRNRQEIIVVLIFLVYAFGFNVYRVQGDGLYYYAFLENVLHIPNPESSTIMLNGASIFTQAGCSYFNVPFYLAAYFIEKLFSLNFNFNGITLRQISINLASNFYLVLSLILVVRILKYLRLKHIVFPILSILFSTSAVTAAVIMPSMTHAVDIFIMTLFIYLIINQENRPINSLLLGLLGTVAILVRYFNFLLIAPVLLYYLYLKKHKETKLFLMGFCGSVWIIPLLLHIHNGTVSPFYESGMVISNTIRESSGILIPLWPKYLLKLLVHPLHGLFVWAPVTIFSAIGLIFAPKERSKLGYLLATIWFLYVFLYGFMSFWSAGWSFTNRYLVNLFPIYVIGLSIFINKYGRRTLWFLTPLTFYSIILFFNWHLCIMNGEFGTPGDIIKAWIKGESFSSIDKTVNLKIFLNRLWQMCRYKYIFKLF